MGDRGWGDWVDEVSAPEPAPPVNGTPPAIPPGVSNGTRDRAYAVGGLRNECNDLAAMAPNSGRNDALNNAVFKMSGFIASGLLSEEEVVDSLSMAATYSGLTVRETQQTMRSALSGGRNKGVLRIVPPPSNGAPIWTPPVNGAINGVAVPGRIPAQVNGDPGVSTANGSANAGADPDDTAPTNGAVVAEQQAEQQDFHELTVQRKAYDLRVLDEGRALWTRQRAAMMGQEPPAMVSMGDFLAVPDEEARFRVEGVFPVGARVMLTAQYKAGKTSLIANLLRCLVDGENFLGRFTVEPVERVLLIDTELDERTLRRWLRDQNIKNTGGINVLSLRGRLSSFGIIDDRTRSEWAQRIAGAQLIMLDCLRPCLDALGLSEDKEAGVFLTAFDALCREAGADEAVMVHHMGHSSERSRGDSRLLDWPDALWKLVREQTDEGGDIETGSRFFSALGRDVLVPESQLDWQPETRALTIVGGGRAEKKAKEAGPDIVAVMSEIVFADGASKNQLINKLKGYGYGRNAARAAVDSAIQDGLLYTTEGARGAIMCQLNPSRTIT